MTVVGPPPKYSLADGHRPPLQKTDRGDAMKLR
jgi:hypothetical protein